MEIPAAGGLSGDFPRLGSVTGPARLHPTATADPCPQSHKHVGCRGHFLGQLNAYGCA